MINQELANILYEIGYFMEMKGVAFKPQAYEKAAIALESMEENVTEIYKRGGINLLLAIPGVGKGIARKIEEYLKTGGIKYYQELKKKIPIDIEELVAVKGIGPKTVKTLYRELGVRNLDDLEKVVREHKIIPLFGFGGKTEKNILENIRFLRKNKGKFLLGEVLPIVREIEAALTSLKEVKKISPAGSIRRRKELIEDIDLLISSANPEKAMAFFVNLSGINKVWARGKTKSSIRLESGINVDLRVVSEKSYGSALQYFTGSKEHNIALRKIAINRGLKLNEHGLFRRKTMISGKSEQEIYKALGMLYVPPEIREDKEEIKMALRGSLPKLIGYNDLKGDLHCHTNWSDGNHSIREMVITAKALGYEYLGISDHAKLAVANGLDEKRLLKQIEEIEKIGKEIKGIKILKGVEVDILANGSLDIKDEVLAKLDYVIAGIHSHFEMKKEKMTQRILKAMENPYINIIAHLTGRRLQKRAGYQIDLSKILKTAREKRIILEINASPARLDLKDINIRRTKKAGVKMIINSDAHHKNQLRLIELGIAQARRGWAEKKDIVNSQSLKKLLTFFN